MPRDVCRQRRVGITGKKCQRVARRHRLVGPTASKYMAGVEGFEPPNGGIKTRCLTTWRHPSIANSLAHRERCAGEILSPRATKLVHSSGTRAAMRSASMAVAQDAKIQEPVPVSRAGAYRDNQSSAAATSGQRARTTGSQSLRPAASKKARIVMRGEFRVNSGLWKTSRVLTPTPG